MAGYGPLRPALPSVAAPLRLLFLPVFVGSSVSPGEWPPTPGFSPEVWWPPSLTAASLSSKGRSRKGLWASRVDPACLCRWPSGVAWVPSALPALGTPCPTPLSPTGTPGHPPLPVPHTGGAFCPWPISTGPNLTVTSLPSQGHLGTSLSQVPMPWFFQTPCSPQLLSVSLALGPGCGLPSALCPCPLPFAGLDLCPAWGKVG